MNLWWPQPGLLSTIGTQALLAKQTCRCRSHGWINMYQIQIHWVVYHLSRRTTHEIWLLQSWSKQCDLDLFRLIQSRWIHPTRFVIFCLFIYSSVFQFIYLGLRFYLFIYSCLFVYVLVCLCIFIYLFSLVCLFIYVLYKPWTTKICQIVCSVNSKKIWICLNESMWFLGFWLHPVVCVLSDKKQQQKHEIWC